MRPPIVLALVPHLAAWGKAHDRQRARRGRHHVRAAVGIDKLAQVGVLYHGLAMLGGGAILGGLVLGAIARVHHRRASSSRPPPSRSPARCSRSSASCTVRRSALP